MASQPSFIPPEEYLRRERLAQYRSEHLNGEIFAMSGTSWKHNTITANVVASLHAQLREGPCGVVSSDQRCFVRTKDQLYTYPNVIVVCGEPQFQDGEFDNLLNPKVLIEILSPSTEAFDRGKKCEMYMQLASLEEYVLISQDQVRVEQFVRQPDNQWLFSAVAELDAAVNLPSLRATLKLSDIYYRVKI